MWPNRNYLEDARKHQEIFRNILRDMEAEEKGLTLDEIHKMYSEGNRYGTWTILDFRNGPFENLGARISENEAVLASQAIATLSRRGTVAKYRVRQDNSVEFEGNILVWRS